MPTVNLLAVHMLADAPAEDFQFLVIGVYYRLPMVIYQSFQVGRVESIKALYVGVNDVMWSPRRLLSQPSNTANPQSAMTDSVF